MTGAKRQRRSKHNDAKHQRRTPASAGASAIDHDEVSPRVLWMLAAALAAVTVLVYAPVWHHPFFSFDDPGYVYENPKVKSGLTLQGVRWAMTSGYFANWHPVTWLSHMLDVQLFGLNAGAHHAVNLLFHVANTLILFALLYRTTGATVRSALVAALFAVHPTHVESVAWVSERKDVLSTFFWLTTTWAYVSYVRSRSIGRYVLIVVLFALGLMTKPMLVTLPFVLLLLDLWPLRLASLDRSSVKMWMRLVLEKVPLLVLAAASSVVTVIVQKQAGAMESLTRLSVLVRAANAVVAYGAYLQKLVWPTGLAVLYPYPDSIAAVDLIPIVLVLLAVMALAVRLRRSHPYLLVGGLWFLGTLVPVIGLVQVGKQSMADRYTYVPSIGLFIMVVWGVASLVRGGRGARVGATVLAATAVFALAIVARIQVGYWESNTTLWSHTIDVTPPNYLAENNIGWDYANEKKHDEAVRHYKASIRLNPKFVGAHTNMALSLAELGRFDEAIAEYDEGLRLAPDNVLVHVNLGIALAKQGRLPDAIAHYVEAIRLKADYAEAHSALGLALTRAGRVDEAITHYNEALRLSPGLAEAHSNLGTALASQGMVDSAIVHFKEAVKLKPDYVDAHNNLGIAFASQSKLDSAVVHFSEATRLNPNYAAAHFGLGSVYQRQGRADDAVREYNAALRINPNHADARRELDALLRRPK